MTVTMISVWDGSSKVYENDWTLEGAPNAMKQAYEIVTRSQESRGYINGNCKAIAIIEDGVVRYVWDYVNYV